MTCLLAVELSDRFWEAAGGPATFPRDLSRAVSFALPLAVLQVARLQAVDLLTWLARRGLDQSLNACDRPLRAGLVAIGGRGVVFVDGTDPADERRFSLAHEVGHFLVEHWWPREQAARRVGLDLLDVLDGGRPLTRAERIDALLAEVPTHPHVHLLERLPDGRAPRAVEAAEQLADELALELLAPIAVAGPLALEAASDPAPVLAERFGLPAAAARRYADRLVPPERPGAEVLERLGLKSPPETSHFGESARNKE